MDHSGSSQNELNVIAPFLMIGGSTVNQYPSLVCPLRITHILNLAAEVEPNFALAHSPFLRYKHIPYHDDPPRYNLRVHFEEAFAFIDNARAVNGRALVHCKHGKSRSGIYNLI